MAILLSINATRALDFNGASSPGALAFFYDSGTTTPRTVYADPECTVPHEIPLRADGAGAFPAIFDAGSGDAKVVVTDEHLVVLPGYPVDPVMVSNTDVTGAAAVPFDPTAEIPVKNVQAAIERVQQNIAAPLADFGLGVTGAAPHIDNIGDAGTASGFYRYSDLTLGTFPPGVDKTQGGIVMIFRRNPNLALMLLQPSSGQRIWVRRLSTTWQGWTWLIDSSDTATAVTWAAGMSAAVAIPSPADVKSAITAQTVGAAQSWVDVTASRPAGLPHRNQTGKPIMVSVSMNAGSSTPALLQVSTNGTTWVTVATWLGERGVATAIIPASHYYRASAGDGIVSWAELR